MGVPNRVKSGQLISFENKIDTFLKRSEVVRPSIWRLTASAQTFKNLWSFECKFTFQLIYNGKFFLLCFIFELPFASADTKSYSSQKKLDDVDVWKIFSLKKDPPTHNHTNTRPPTHTHTHAHSPFLFFFLLSEQMWTFIVITSTSMIALVQI